MGRTFRIIGQAVKQGFLSFFRNIWLSLASILVTTLAISVIICSLVINLAAQKAIVVLIEDLTVSVYIKPNADPAQVGNLDYQLKKLDNVVSVEYVSSQQAEAQFIEHFQDDEDLIRGLEVVGDYQLPASLVVAVDDLDRIDEINQIANRAEFSQIVDSVSSGAKDSQQIVEKAQSLRQFIVVGGSALGGVFAIIAFLIIYNAVRIAIFSRKREIQIMSLIGARIQFIRGIFFVEVILIGLFSGLLATGATYGGLFLMESFIEVFLGESFIVSQPELVPAYELLKQPDTIIKTMLASIVGSIILGLISASLALKRYLRFF